MTIKEAYESWPTLMSLMSRKNIPQALSFKIARQAQKLRSDIELYQKNRTELIKKLGEQTEAVKNEQGEVVKPSTWIVKPENEEEFKKENEAMNSIEIKVKIDTIKKEEFPKKINLEPIIYFNLGWLIK